MADSSGAGGAAGQMVDMFINIFGRSAAEAQAREGQNAISNAYYEALGLIPPDLDAIDLQQQGNTELGNIAEDPRLREYQMKALDQLAGVVDAGGVFDQQIVCAALQFGIDVAGRRCLCLCQRQLAF